MYLNSSCVRRANNRVVVLPHGASVSMRNDQYRAVASIVLLLGFGSAAAAEQINKCTDSTGKVIYQKEPCGEAQKSEQKQLDPDRNAIKMEIPPPSAPPPSAGDSMRDN